MKTYEKIETVYMRDINGTKNLIEGSFRNETVEMLKDICWEWTEKIDGTNIRVMWDGHEVHFGGRTDKANIPAELVNRLNKYFMTDEAEEMFEQLFGDKEVIIFGEGYGRKIQAVGKDYLPNCVDFAVFDVMIGNNYQSRSVVTDIARSFGLNIVPVAGYGNLEDAIKFIKTNPVSEIGSCNMEGIVCRPEHELRDRCGNRIIVKIKWKDFEPFVKENN